MSKYEAENSGGHTSPSQPTSQPKKHLACGFHVPPQKVAARTPRLVPAKEEVRSDGPLVCFRGKSSPERLLLYRRLSRLSTVFAILLVWAGAAWGQDFDEVPYYTCADPTVWANLFTGAHTDAKRIAILGDSQETSPGTEGGQCFLTRLNFEAYQTYGATPETTIVPATSYAGSPAGEWLTRGGHSDGASAAGIAANLLLPGMAATQFEVADNGMIWMLQPRGTAMYAGTQLADADKFWNNTDDTVADVWFYTLSGENPGTKIFVRPQDSTTPSLGSAATQTFDEDDLGLDAATGTVVTYTTVALDWNSLANQQLIVTANDGDSGDIVVCAHRFRSEIEKGVAFATFSAGGYKATDLLASHASAGPLLAAMGPWDAILLTYGANDCVNNVSPATFKTNLQALITAIRGASWLNNASQKIIITSDPYQTSATEPQLAMLEGYPAVVAEIAAADPNILAINDYRIMYDLGLNPDTYTEFLSDAVHHSDHGARTRARAMWQAILSAQQGEPCE